MNFQESGAWDFIFKSFFFIFMLVINVDSCTPSKEFLSD